ncbi:MAG: DNA translocase FtsK, partial [Ruminococcus sp.]|nr:DNA translocase FtsK [Ruminococcus sp.]
MSAKKQTTNKKTKAPAKTQKGRSRAGKQPAPVVHKGLSPRIRAIIFGTIALLFIVMIAIKGENVWTAVRSFFFGTLGFGIFLVPVLMGYFCIITEKEKSVAHVKAKTTISILIVLLIGAMNYMLGGAKYNDLNFFACLGKLYLESADITAYMTFGCGLFGGILGYPIVFLCGEVAGFCIALIATIMLIFIIANISIKDMTAAASRKVNHMREVSEKRAIECRQRREVMHREREIKKNSTDIMQYSAQNNNTDAIDIPLDEPKSRKKKKKRAVKSGIDIDYADPNEENAKDKDLSEDLINIINRASKPLGEDADSTVEDIADDISQEKRSNRITDGAKQADPETVPVVLEDKPSKKVNQDKNSELSEFDNIGYKTDNSDKEVKEEKIYHYPPVQLLKPNTNNNDRHAMEELQTNSKKLIETLNSFGVNASITNICRGPSVTRYELQPAPGVKI